MTSLEHESNDTSVSASDYGADNWDQENWGDMDVSYCLFKCWRQFLTLLEIFQTSQDPSSPLAGPTASVNLTMNATGNALASSPATDIRDGWENDEWGSLEEEPANEELEEKENEKQTNHVAASRSNSNSHSSSLGISSNNNLINNVSPSRNNGSGETLLNSSSNSNSNWENHGTNWNDDEFEPIDEPGGELKAQ